VNLPVTVDDIRAAARRIEGRVLRTPLRYSQWLSERCGVDVFHNIETVQPTRSYKVPGAFNAVLALVEKHGVKAPPLVTASAGNHGNALAHAARAAKLALTVYVPENAPRTKLDAIRTTGATLETCRDYDEAEIRAKEHAARGEALFISPYSHPDVIAGAGTIALEILADQPEIRRVLVPVGGGGLISGIAIAVKGSSTTCEVRGVEVAASTPFTCALAAGRIVPIEVGDTLADGLSGNLDPDTVTFDIVRTLVDGIDIVTEPQLVQAITGLAKEERLIAEGAGAAATACVLAHCASGGPVAVIVSGANIDLEKLKRIIQSTPTESPRGCPRTPNAP
jgi:threonine dehydratase